MIKKINCTKTRYTQFLLLVLLLLGNNTVKAENDENIYIKAKCLKNDDIKKILERYKLIEYQENIDYFMGLNRLGGVIKLKKGKQYLLPIYRYAYNGKSIRSSLGLSDWATAEAIAEYNHALYETKVRKEDLFKSRELWVPHHLLKGQTITPTENKKSDPNKTSETKNEKDSDLLAENNNFDIFGKENAKVKMISNKLNGQVFYIVSGHGGPDPGAIAKRNGKRLHEDEYAYDIALRLTRNLISNGAKAYMIIRDPEDGIRESAYLKPSQGERCWPNEPIPLDQVERLEQRANAINKLYDQNKKAGAKSQQLIVLHLDSRHVNKQIELFFYHKKSSINSKKLALKLQKTIKKKYSEHGKNYNGIVKSRDLFMLRETKPTAVYIEIGNMQNTQDQRRFVPADNRQAIANWLNDGLMSKK